MPKNVAQWTGLTVTLIIALGCDRDVFYALPIGILAGAAATAVVALDDWRIAAVRKPAMAHQHSVIAQD